MPVRLDWELITSDPQVIRYELERRPIGPSQNMSRARRITYTLWGRNIMGGWRRVSDIPPDQNRYIDDGRMLARRVFRSTYTHNTEVLNIQSYEYRIRAVNANGAGQWRHCIVNPSSTPLVDYNVTGTVSELISGRAIGNAQITVRDPLSSRFPAQRTDGTGNYMFDLGGTPPGAPLNENIFCDAGPLYLRVFRIGAPMPAPATPNIIINFEIERLWDPRTRGPLWILPPDYDYWI